MSINWISVEDRLPPRDPESYWRSKWVAVWLESGRWVKDYYDFRHKTWMGTFGPPRSLETHWAEIEGPRPQCLHESTQTHWDYLECDECGAVLMGRLNNDSNPHKTGGRAWWPSIEHAHFFYKNGQYLDGVKPLSWVDYCELRSLGEDKEDE